MLLRTPPAVPGPVRALGELRTGPVVAAVVALTALVRVPFLTDPLSPDEAGFLSVAEQWAPGSSLYGDYWVDRPPLLIGLFDLADAAGGTVPLRLLGVVAAVVSVVLAARIARLTAPGRPWAPVVAAAVAASLVSTPLTGAQQVNGELLALPLVLGGLLAVLVACRPGRHPVAWVLAGVLGTGAMAVKQSVVDVLVAVAVAALWVGRRRAGDAVRGLAAAAAGAAVTLGVLLAWAASRGTTPAELWDAVIVFRVEAGGVISDAAPDVTHDRALDLVMAAVLSGIVLVLGVALIGRRVPRLPSAVGLVGLAVVAVELVVVVGGGSYWRHYLVGLVPGLVLLACGTAERRPRRTLPLLAVTAWTVVSAVVVMGIHLRPSEPSDRERVQEWLAEHVRPGDTAVTAFGDPTLLRVPGLSSPYPHLWSLPVRVRDPELAQLATLLSGPERPDWVLARGTSLTTWGVDAGRAQRVLEEHYRPVADVGGRRIYAATEPAAR